MKISIPDNIDLTHPEKYVLIIGLDPEQFSFSLYSRDENYFLFHCDVPQEKGRNVFFKFKEILFENEFLTFLFHRILVINYNPIFTFVPEILFQEKDEKAYIDFLFSEKQGKILTYYLKKTDLVVLHTMEEDMYEFLYRSFINIDIIPYSAPFISYFSNYEKSLSEKRMILNKRSEGIDIFCFQQDKLLLTNYFPLLSAKDAVYYPLFVWRQLKYSQQNDYLYLVKEDEELFGSLGKYILNISYVEEENMIAGETASIFFES